jgi:hypothetical protein
MPPSFQDRETNLIAGTDSWGHSNNAKQLMTAMITLVSSIASFYFAATSVNQATQQGIDAGKAAIQPSAGSATVTSAEYDPKGAKVIVTGTGLNTISQLDLRLDSGSPVISTNQLSLVGDKLTADFKDHPIPPGTYQVAVVVANGPSVPTQTQLTVLAQVSLESAVYELKLNAVKLTGRFLLQIASVLLVPENGDPIVADNLSGTDTERLANFKASSIPPAKYTVAYSIGEEKPIASSLKVDASTQSTDSTSA